MKKIKNWIVCRLSDYEELKKENEKLRKDIYIIAGKGDTLEGIRTFMIYRTEYEMSNIYFQGDIENKDRFTGLLDSIQ